MQCDRPGKDGNIEIQYLVRSKDKMNDQKTPLETMTMRLFFENGENALKVYNSPAWIHIKHMELWEQLEDGFWVPLAILQAKLPEAHK